LAAAVSAGILEGQAVVDLDYEEDKLVTVDFNLVATEDGEFVEVQSSGEEATFAGSQRHQRTNWRSARRFSPDHGHTTAGKSFVGRPCQTPCPCSSVGVSQKPP